MSKQQNKKTPSEKKSLKLEILEKISILITAGFGLVAALAWNEAIKALFAQLFPDHGGNLIAMFLYALLVTVFVVIITVQLGRAISKLKQFLDKKKKP